jgi:hypothetical protein
MDVDNRKIGRKTSGLRTKKVKADTMTQEGTSSKVEMVTPTLAKVGADIKTSLCTICFTWKILTIGQRIALFSLSPKRRWHKGQPNLRHQAQWKKSTTHPTRTDPTFAIIVFEPTFVPKPQPSLRMPTQPPQISHAILSAIQLHTTSKPNTYTTARNHLSVATTANNIPHPKITSIPTKNGAKQSTSTSTHKPRIFPSSNKLSSVRNYSHYHWGSNLTFKNKR